MSQKCAGRYSDHSVVAGQMQFGDGQRCRLLESEFRSPLSIFDKTQVDEDYFAEQ